MVVLGFDPGGVGQFGWCVAEGTANGRLSYRESGLADNASTAVAASLERARRYSDVKAAGIDSPLFWLPTGTRYADVAVRDAMKVLEAPNVGGTVQEVNSLRGACLAQGLMAAYLLRLELPNIRLTESHPKALLWLLKIATSARRVAGVTMEDLDGLISCSSVGVSDHQRDAALGAVAAWKMLTRSNGWKDLRKKEKGRVFEPVSPVEYWMPIGAGA